MIFKVILNILINNCKMSIMHMSEDKKEKCKLGKQGADAPVEDKD